MNKFGEKLAILRERHRLSLKQLADKLGVGKSFVWNMEQGKKIPNAAMILKIAKVFNITPNQLMLDDLELD